MGSCENYSNQFQRRFKIRSIYHKLYIMMANFFNQLVLGWLWCVVTQFEMTYHVEDVGDLAVVVDAVDQDSS